MTTTSDMDLDHSHISESDPLTPFQVHRQTKAITYPTRSHYSNTHRHKSQIDINSQVVKLVRGPLSTNDALAVIQLSRGLGALIHLHLPQNHLISHPQILHLLLNVPPMCLFLFSQLQK